MTLVLLVALVLLIPLENPTESAVYCGYCNIKFQLSSLSTTLAF